MTTDQEAGRDTGLTVGQEAGRYAYMTTDQEAGCDIGLTMGQEAGRDMT